MSFYHALITAELGNSLPEFIKSRSDPVYPNTPMSKLHNEGTKNEKKIPAALKVSISCQCNSWHTFNFLFLVPLGLSFRNSRVFFFFFSKYTIHKPVT